MGTNPSPSDCLKLLRQDRAQPSPGSSRLGEARRSANSALSYCRVRKPGSSRHSQSPRQRVNSGSLEASKRCRTRVPRSTLRRVSLVHSCVERRASSEARRASISASLCSIVLRANSDPLRFHVLGLSFRSLSAETTSGVHAFDLFKRTMTTLLPSPSRSMSRMPEASARSTRRGKP